MPQANPLLGPGSASPSPPSVGGSVPTASGVDHGAMRGRIANAMRGIPQDTLIQRRDTAPKEAAYLAQVIQDPNANVQEIERYLGSLVRVGQFSPQEAVQVLRTLPRSGNPKDVQNWAQAMLAAVTHVAVHLHAAFPRSVFPGQQTQAEAQDAQQQPQQAEDGETDDADAEEAA